MNSLKIFIYCLLLSIIFLSSCATIVGGANYKAQVEVSDPNAKIFYNGQFVGKGVANFKVRRNQANKFSFEVKKDGCDTKKYYYTKRKFRGWAFVASILFLSVRVDNIILPISAAIDVITGACWKPSVLEKGVSKVSYKTFKYYVNYNDCNQQVPQDNARYDYVYLKNGSRIKGKIIELVQDVKVKIETKDGSLFVFKFEEIEKITNE